MNTRGYRWQPGMNVAESAAPKPSQPRTNRNLPNHDDLRPTTYELRLASLQFLHVFSQKFAQAREARVLCEIGLGVIQRPGDVLDVNRVAARRRLEAECAERLQVALQRHQVEAAAELLLVGGAVGAGGRATQREKERDQ